MLGLSAAGSSRGCGETHQRLLALVRAKSPARLRNDWCRQLFLTVWDGPNFLPSQNMSGFKAILQVASLSLLMKLTPVSVNLGSVHRHRGICREAGASRRPSLAAPGDAHDHLPRSFSSSQSYLQAASDGPAGHSLDPSAHYNSPKFRSRNQSYMRAVSTLSQASCVSQVGLPVPLPRAQPPAHAVPPHPCQARGPHVSGSYLVVSPELGEQRWFQHVCHV